MLSTAGLGSDLNRKKEHSVLLVDERPLMLECTSNSLWAGAQDIRIIGFPSIDGARAALEDAMRPDLIILSTGIARASDAHVRDGIRKLAAAMPSAPIVILSDLDDDKEAGEAGDVLRLGARGYIRSSMRLEVMIAALRLVLAGGTFIPDSVLSRLGLGERGGSDGQSRIILPDLTPRESQILQCLREGKPNKIIARELSLSVGTVQVHVRRILQKLNATSRSQIAYIVNQLQPATPITQDAPPQTAMGCCPRRPSE